MSGVPRGTRRGPRPRPNAAPRAVSPPTTRSRPENDRHLGSRDPAGGIPWLPPRSCGAGSQGIAGERLARLLGVLGQQREYLVLREVPQTQGPGLDVEGAAAGNDLVRGARSDSVVAYVAHAAQNDALGEPPGAPHVARPELAQHRQQGVADQGVDLVDQEDQGPGIGLGPPAQPLAEGAGRTCLRQEPRPFPVEKIVSQRRPPPRREFRQNGTHGLLDVLAHGLPGFEIGVHAPVVARLAAVQQILQCQQGGGLAGLPGRVQHEVALVPDEGEHLVEFQPTQRRDRIVLGRADRAGRIEEAHGSGSGRGSR